MKRRFRMRALAVALSAALAAALGTGLPVAAAEVAKTGETSHGQTATFESIRTIDFDVVMMPNGDNPPTEPNSEHQGSVDADPIRIVLFEQTADKIRVEQSTKGSDPENLTKSKLAQFQLPGRQAPTQPAQQEVYAPSLGAPPRPETHFLNYEYSYGSESQVIYRRDPDLNKQVKDNSLILVPQVNGMFKYRPSDWLETTVEMIADREIAVQEEDVVFLPNGEIRYAGKRELSLLVDQAFVTMKASTAPIEFSFGRRNYEDERHWLYDTSMDVARAQLKLGQFRAEGTFGREVLYDLDLFKKEAKDRINTTMLYVEYRGIEDTKLAVYTIRRDDLTHQEGRPLHLGLRALGAPFESFKYWVEGDFLRGRDEFSREFSGTGVDIGGTYVFKGLPFSPAITLGYAFGSGDANPNDNKNYEFRQTGLQSNERAFAGLSDFKYYGEGLDPELSNLKIITVGLGFRPLPTVYVDLVYHRYNLHRIADGIRNSALTAEINQDDTHRTRDMGSGFDIVVGVRNLFGIRRLGLDLRVGWYFPGSAYRIQQGDPDDPTFRSCNNGVSAIAKFWY